eukprot:COSAG04_NODE_14461_length_567_cov_0.720085_1_plen_135_part_10
MLTAEHRRNATAKYGSGPWLIDGAKLRDFGAVLETRANKSRMAAPRLAAVVGGFDGAKPLATVEGYDAESRGWRALPSLRTARRDAAVCGLRDGSLLACSGTDGQTWLRSCERYDPERHEWTELPPMPSAPTFDF